MDGKYRTDDTAGHRLRGGHAPDGSTLILTRVEGAAVPTLSLKWGRWRHQY